MGKEIKNIISNIKRGLLTRDTDEKGAEGFWDLAGEIACDALECAYWEVSLTTLVIAEEELQEKIYNHLWEVYECSVESLGN